ncbi:hypothetical protein N7510_006831 [Penicillium lagena]|uniref:uncharacterized protein n=1 Tax=Penicillium lagena TaxID=94218 RepID=UPI002541A6D1|nr:uncharacterized protein N7510_006831 [Penicillium lagena]KAJ5610112.1 hypothetical protein N7510_006831 [Penicillium lagena]
MGSWDYYCALCGSTFFGGKISQKPRSARFLRARRLSAADRQIEKLTREGAPIPEELHREFDENNEESSEDKNDASSMDEFDEDHRYDPNVITEEESTWTLDLQCLGLNSESSPSKAFLSGIGTSEDYGGLRVDAGDDPNYPDDDFFSAYCITGESPVYPFHPKCLDLFRLLVAHKSGSGATPVSVDGSWIPLSLDLDKDTLFAILHERGKFSSRLDIDYGDPEPPDEQFWESKPGEELFIADPTRDDELVKSMILTRVFFPYKPIERFPHVHRALDGSSSLWLRYIGKAMPWFFELHDFLGNLTDSNDDGHGTTSSNADALRDKSLRRFFVWADRITTPRVGKKGPFIGVANRRRIWAVIEDATEEAA